MEDKSSNSVPLTSDPTSDGGFFSKIFKGDKIIWSVFIFLCIISLIEVFSATSTIVYRQTNHWGPILRHATFLLGGVGVILFMHNVPYKYFSWLVLVLFVSVILVVLTWFMGTTVNGADRWLSIMGVTIQPSEIVKISLVGTIAFLLSKQNEDNERTMFLWMIGLMTGVCLIIAKDNLSTGALLFGVCFILMYIGHVKFKHLAKTALIGAALLVMLVFLLKVTPPEWLNKMGLKRADTWVARIDKFGSTPDNDEASYYKITDDNYQVAHSKIAIANGGVLGRFPGNSQERDFLPQAYSDFIYSIILEEMGLLGGTFVLILYIIILMRAGKIARKTDKLFPKYLILGSAMMLAMQAFVNMAVAVHLIPVTGQPLPLISRGGTSTLITCAYFGIILSADRFGMCKKKVMPEVEVKMLNIDQLQIENGEQDVDQNPFAKVVLHEEYAPKVEFDIAKV